MTADALASHVHLHVPAPGPAPSRTLLLLHGTGGDERSLLKLAPMLDPGAAALAPRGNVLENGMPRFFRRVSEGVFDVPDMHARAAALADWIAAACDRYAIDPASLVAVGYSNGANVAAAVMYQRPGLLRCAVLFRAMAIYRTPRWAPPPADLTGTDVLVASGRGDPIAPPADARALAEALAARGARVTTAVDEGDHALTREAIDAARAFLATRAPA